MRVYRGGGGGGIAFDAGSSSCCFFLFSSIARLFSSPSFSFTSRHGRGPPRRWARPIYIRPRELRARALTSHAEASLLLNALASAHACTHAHAYPLLRAQPAHGRASRADTEAPRIPCCANNTTAHVRDISFYYYPCVRFLSLLLRPASSSAVTFSPAVLIPFLLPRRPFARFARFAACDR